MAMLKEGVTEEEAKSKIWMVDSKGLLVKDRPKGGLTEHKLHFARDGEPIDTLLDVVRTAKPSVIIGAAAVRGAFTTEILREMARNNEIPVIFALSNPTSKAECTAEEAYIATEVRNRLRIYSRPGNCVFQTFFPVIFKSFNFSTVILNYNYVRSHYSGPIKS